MDRLSRLVAQTLTQDDTAILIHKPSNVYYISGYAGEGLLVIAHGLNAIVTDFRYTEQAGMEAPGWQVHEISPGNGHTAVAARLLTEAGIRKVLYEDDHVSVRGFDDLQGKMPDMQFTSLERAPEKLRTIKDADELRLIETACDLSSRAYDDICGQIKPGMTELDIKLKLEYHMLSLGAQRLAFSSIVASGPNGSLPHAVPGERKVQLGDLITLDFGAKVGGYCADITRTVALGKPSAQLKEIYDIVQQAQAVCQEALKPGIACKEVDAMARDIIAQAGYGKYFGHGLGHGVGLDIHEAPRLSQTESEILQEGHVVTVEPGIYLPGVGGVRIENTCAVTADGARSLISAGRDLRILS